MMIVPENKHARRFAPLTPLMLKLHDGRGNVPSRAGGVLGPSCKLRRFLRAYRVSRNLLSRQRLGGKEHSRQESESLKHGEW